jgi:hypothetical protein
MLIEASFRQSLKLHSRGTKPLHAFVISHIKCHLFKLGQPFLFRLHTHSELLLVVCHHVFSACPRSLCAFQHIPALRICLSIRGESIYRSYRPKSTHDQVQKLSRRNCILQTGTCSSYDAIRSSCNWYVPMLMSSRLTFARPPQAFERSADMCIYQALC